MNAELRGDPVIDFPVTGECWVLNVSGWARPVRSPLDGEVLVGHDGEPDPIGSSPPSDRTYTCK